MPFLRIKTWSNKRRHAKDGYALNRILRKKYYAGDFSLVEHDVLRFTIDMEPREFTRDKVLDAIRSLEEYEAGQ